MLGKILRKIILPVFVLITVFASGKTYAFEIGAEADYWITSLSGDIKSGMSGTKLDFNDNLNTDGYNSAGINLHIEAGNHMLSIGYTPLSYSGTTTLSNLINVQGSQFASDIKSGLRLNMTDVQYTYWIVNSSMGMFAKVGITAALKNLDFAGFVEGIPTSGSTLIREERSKTLAIPMVGLRAEMGLGDFVKVAVSGSGVGYGGNSFIDAMAAVEVSPLPFVGVALGYRTVSIKLDADNAKLNAASSGPFVGFFASF